MLSPEETNPESAGALSHDQAALFVSRAWDNELSQGERALLEQHLEHCAACATAARNLREFLHSLDKVLQHPTRPDGS